MACSLPGSSVHGILQAKTLGVGCPFLLQGIFPAQGLNPALLHCRRMPYHLRHQGSPKRMQCLPPRADCTLLGLLYACHSALVTI